ncbi:MAG TPA: PSD1 and planctomycete cytochrome C domain-containing protein [Bryobacteraceae bacterium]|nr:PSD1 and planctomycete cytochrome C domain-containing protein [Bryobacteraceae bacterium]
MLRIRYALLILWAAGLAAQTADQIFSKILQPVLERDCQGCHGSTQALSKFDVRTREALIKGGARGTAIVPGNADASLLIHVLEGRNKLQMPPGGDSKKMSPEVISGFRAWVDAGAPWPEKSADSKWAYKEEDLWAFRPLRRFGPEKGIDDFINAQLAERGIAAAAKADRHTLIRRATFDLTGLPPTPEEVAAFLVDKSPDAWKNLVERLLASPQYGERWGRHWLDVVRYADTSGYSNDFERPNAWRYRDYVIRSFNQDKPYDQFIREQIAGDELYPNNPEAIIATGFLRAGPWEHTAMSVEAVTRQLFLDDVTHATAATFLGLTLGCAKCHDHKFDPIPTRDYYSMQAVFASTEFARPKLPFQDYENTSDLPGSAAQMRALYDRSKAKMDAYRTAAALDLMKKHGVSRPEDLPKGELDRAMAEGLGMNPEKFEEFKLYQKHSQLFQESLDRFEPKAYAVSSGPVDGATDGGGTLKYVKRADYKPAVIRVLPGGNIQAPTEPVAPGLLSALEKYGAYPSPMVPDSVTGRRSVLAKWIADPKNPLTARVMVNRIWQDHFGRGIAGDTNNLGKMGKKPTHPELLDSLAQRFIDGGWSVKNIHRLIMMSDTYQRASTCPEPRATLFACFSPRRIEAEVLRDSILAASGELSVDAGGPGTFPQINEDVARQPQHRMGSLAPAYHSSPLRRQRNRRTIYMFQQRSLVDPMVEVFNGPSLDLSCERREASIVPTQAFTLFNSQFVHDMALAMASRIAKEGRGVDAQIRRAFQLAYGREPEPRELELSRVHVDNMVAFHRGNAPPEKLRHKRLVHKITSELTGQTFEFVQQEDPLPYEPNLHASDVSPQIRALSDLTLTLLNSNEFLYVY